MDRLRPLQRAVLDAWFQLSSDFYLTGGGALIAYFGVARRTDDLDLFTTSREAFHTAPGIALAICEKLQVELQSVRTAPFFHRYRIQRGDELTLLDVVFDPVPQIHSQKQTMADGVIVDPLDEILVNKICALVGRAEPRDFFDVYVLATHGQDLDCALALAATKDSGVDAEALLFVLGAIDWDQFDVPGQDESTVRGIVSFFRSLVEKLALDAFPRESR